MTCTRTNHNILILCLAWLGLLSCWLVRLAWLGLLVCAWQKRTASIRHSAANTTTDVPLGADRAARLHRGKVLSRMYIIWAWEARRGGYPSVYLVWMIRTGKFWSRSYIVHGYHLVSLSFVRVHFVMYVVKLSDVLCSRCCMLVCDLGEHWCVRIRRQ
jgi:hypothetical protein